MVGRFYPNESGRSFPSTAQRAFPIFGSESFIFDASFASVTLLLHMEGANGSDLFPDNSNDNRTVTDVGSARVNTGDSRFGGASLLLDGTGDYLSVPDDNVFSVDGGDFTIDLSVNLASLKLHTPINKRDSASAEEFSFYIDSNNKPLFQMFRSGSAVLQLTSVTSLITSTWHDLAVTRSGLVTTLFADGLVVASGTQSNTPSVNASPVKIGRDGFNTGRDLNGRIDEVRFTSGVARYTNSYAVHTVAFPDF